MRQSRSPRGRLRELLLIFALLIALVAGLGGGMPFRLVNFTGGATSTRLMFGRGGLLLVVRRPGIFAPRRTAVPSAGRLLI